MGQFLWDPICGDLGGRVDDQGGRQVSDLLGELERAGWRTDASHTAAGPSRIDTLD
jgi:hypothetical protein